MSDQILPMPKNEPHVFVHRPRHRPVATYVILAINGVAFLLTTLAGGSQNPNVLLDFGASYGPYIRRGEYWRLVMPMFLHVGLLHLLVNAYALYILGRILEAVYGYGRFALLYVGAGVGGSFLSMALSNSVAAGASGAIFGIAGAMLVTGYVHRGVIPPRWGRAFGKGILPFIIANLALGFSVKMIDNWGHLGGLTSGIFLSFLIAPPGAKLLPQGPEEESSQRIVLVPVIIVALAMGTTFDHFRVSRVVGKLLGEGERLRKERQYGPAEAQFRGAARYAPRDERPHRELGLLYLEEKRLPEAIQEFHEALRLSPGSPEAHLGLVQAYRQKGDLAKAQQYLEAVVGKNPADGEGQRALGDLCAEQKLYAAAIQHYQEALRLDPKNAAAENNLAWLYATSEDPKFRNPSGALEHAQRAVTLTQWKQAEFVDTLAEALYANGKFAEAVRVQTRALQLNPRSPELQEHMARYRKAAGG